MAKRDRSPSEPEAMWKEKDMSSGKTVDAMVLILRTSGCSWAKKKGCTMCGYNVSSAPEVSADDLRSQLAKALSRYDGEPFVKIYTSGSFLDDGEIPPEVRGEILSAFSGCERILFESRPSYATSETMSQLPKNCTIAFGLESSDPAVMRDSISKGFTPADVERAGLEAKALGLSVRSYVLLKPPYLTEARAIEDAVSTAMFADAFSDEISINPVNVQRHTVVEKLWKSGEYRPPWLWSLVEVIARLHGKVSARVMSFPSGGGTPRGVHNCGECDQRILSAVERYSFSGNIDDLSATCSCHGKWENYITSEAILGSSADLDRGLTDDMAVGMK